VVYDIYIEHHASTVSSEQMKEAKSLGKCFKKLDLNKSGVLEWRLFCEMMLHLRPDVLDITHNYLIFREIAHHVSGKSDAPGEYNSQHSATHCTEQMTRQGCVGIDLAVFNHLQDWVCVVFKQIDIKNQDSLQWWAWVEYRCIMLDALLVMAQMDNVVIYVSLQLGDIQVWLLSAIHMYLYHTYPISFNLGRSWADGWRMLDLLLLYAALVSQTFHSSCHSVEMLHGRWLCEAPYWQLFNVVSACRVLRVALHKPESRVYLLSVSQITPVLLHFGVEILKSQLNAFSSTSWCDFI